MVSCWSSRVQRLALTRGECSGRPSAREVAGLHRQRRMRAHGRRGSVAGFHRKRAGCRCPGTVARRRRCRDFTGSAGCRHPAAAGPLLRSAGAAARRVALTRRRMGGCKILTRAPVGMSPNGRSLVVRRAHGDDKKAQRAVIARRRGEQLKPTPKRAFSIGPMNGRKGEKAVFGSGTACARSRPQMSLFSSVHRLFGGVRSCATVRAGLARSSAEPGIPPAESDLPLFIRRRFAPAPRDCFLSASRRECQQECIADHQ